MKPALAFSVAAAMALHAVGGWMASQSHRSSAGVPLDLAPGGANVRLTVLVRRVAPTSSPPAATAESVRPQPAPKALPAPAQSGLIGEGSPTPAANAVRHDSVSASADELAPPLDTDQPAGPPKSMALGDGLDPLETDVYIRHAMLTRPPVPQSTVLLTYPSFPGDTGSYVAELLIFIDPDGVVRRIRVEPPGLPDALEAEARHAFLQVRFQPGEVAGVPVRSLMRVEVRFDR